MDLSFSEAEQQLKDEAREFLAEEAPNALVRRLEEDERGYSPELWQKMAARGWTGLAVASEYGGRGGSFLDVSVVYEEMGRAMTPGPLADELSLMLREIRLGTTRSDALRNLAERCGVPEISSFSSVLIQADRLGASIGSVLRAQADLMRTERFQRAEKAGARASSVVLVPLVLFILPAALLVIVGPVILRFIYGIG